MCLGPVSIYRLVCLYMEILFSNTFSLGLRGLSFTNHSPEESGRLPLDEEMSGKARRGIAAKGRPGLFSETQKRLVCDQMRQIH